MGRVSAETSSTAPSPAPASVAASAPIPSPPVRRVSAETSPAAGGAPTREEIQAAVARLRQDPNLGAEHTIHSLRWVDRQSPPAQSPPWILGLFQYLARAARWAMWLAGTVVVAIAGVWLYRSLKGRAAPGTGAVKAARASHVGDLDIRPNSLPDDIGAAALALVDDGKTRDALSLLYRGALSRAVHRYDVTIRESFTEGEALRAVDARLDRAHADYFRELVGLWQRAVYAGQVAARDPVAALCDRFSTVLGSVA